MADTAVDDGITHRFHDLLILVEFGRCNDLDPEVVAFYTGEARSGEAVDLPRLRHDEIEMLAIPIKCALIVIGRDCDMIGYENGKRRRPGEFRTVGLLRQ